MCGRGPRQPTDCSGVGALAAGSRSAEGWHKHKLTPPVRLQRMPSNLLGMNELFWLGARLGESSRLPPPSVRLLAGYCIETLPVVLRCSFPCIQQSSHAFDFRRIKQVDPRGAVPGLRVPTWARKHQRCRYNPLHCCCILQFFPRHSFILFLPSASWYFAARVNLEQPNHRSNLV